MTTRIIHPLITCYGKKGHIRGGYISAKLVEKTEKQTDLSLSDHNFDLTYCQWNTTEPDAVPNVSFLNVFFMIITSPSISSSYISTFLCVCIQNAVASQLESG